MKTHHRSNWPDCRASKKVVEGSGTSCAKNQVLHSARDDTVGSWIRSCHAEGYEFRFSIQHGQQFLERLPDLRVSVIVLAETLKALFIQAATQAWAVQQRAAKRNQVACERMAVARFRLCMLPSFLLGAA